MMLSDGSLSTIFKKSKRNKSLIGTNEGVSIEYKSSFVWVRLAEYLKTMCAYANREGGYIVFGIKDKPHELLGLDEAAADRFETIDNHEWSTNIREHFAPEIIWEKRLYQFEDRVYGIIYTYEAKEKPIMCIKSYKDELRKASIYYRYNSQSSEIDYPELKAIIDTEKNIINERWMNSVRQLGEKGIEEVALLDITNGQATNGMTTLYLDEKLLNDLKFVYEGRFVNTGGDPALKILGEVATVVGAKKIVTSEPYAKAINSDEIINSFTTQQQVNNPREYIKQIAYENTGNYPMFYYSKLAGLSREGLKAEIMDIPTNSKAKEIMLRRVNGKTSFCPISKGDSIAAKRKRKYYEDIINESLMLPENDRELMYCLQAIRAISKEDLDNHKDYILNVMFKTYKRYFNSPNYKKVRLEFRYTLCWIDEALFMVVDDSTPR